MTPETLESVGQVPAVFFCTSAIAGPSVGEPRATVETLRGTGRPSAERNRPLRDKKGRPTQSRCCSAMNWQPISSAPAGVAVLVYRPEWDTVRVAIGDADTGVWQEPNGDLVETPIWWQPAPELSPALDDPEAR